MVYTCHVQKKYLKNKHNHPHVFSIGDMLLVFFAGLYIIYLCVFLMSFVDGCVCCLCSGGCFVPRDVVSVG